MGAVLISWSTTDPVILSETSVKSTAEKMIPKYGSRVEGSPRDQPSQSEPAKTPPESTPPQPNEERSYVREESDPGAASRALVASHELQAQLEAAEQRIADLTAETEASDSLSMARPSAPGPASPEPPRYEPKASPGFLRRGSGNYRDPSATSQLLRQTTARRKARGRVILVAGLAVPLVALLLWGACPRLSR